MKRVLVLLAMTLAAGAPASGSACGVCVEDKVAATYDHTVIRAAIAKHQQVVFVAVESPGAVSDVNVRIAAAASKVRGVQASTLRTSTAPPASFALDAGQRPEAAVAAFRRAIGDKSAHLTLLRVMRDGALNEP